MIYLFPQDVRRRKGINVTNQTIILFDKYQVIRPLGSGANSQVYLVRHLDLDVERAIKVSPKTAPCSSQIYAEAKLLKELQHSGIPQIYDLEEDETNLYLIEEYVDGISLSNFLIRQTTVSPNDFFDIALQICEIFIYLHGFAPSPIYYQDLKPEHILIREGKVKLIDFSIQMNPAEPVSEIYGNAGFSAPEVLAQNQPTVQSDIYTLGKLFIHFATHVGDWHFRKVFPILKKATNSIPYLRYETVEELRDELAKAQSQFACSTSCTHISVIGSFHGCGSTHIAISLTSALRKLGYRALYYECNEGDSLRKSAESGLPFKRQEGIYHFHHFAGMPLYGPGITVDSTDEQIAITDCGPQFHEQILSSSDLILLIADGSPWRIKDCIAMNEYLSPFSKHLCIISNYGNKRTARILSHKLSVPVYSYPIDYNPFEVTREKLKLCKKLLPGKGGSPSKQKQNKLYPQAH